MTCTATELDLPGSAAASDNRMSGTNYTFHDVFNFVDDLVFRAATWHGDRGDQVTHLLGRITKVSYSALDGVWVDATWTTAIDCDGLPEKQDGRDYGNRVALFVRFADFTNDTVTSRS